MEPHTDVGQLAASMRQFEKHLREHKQDRWANALARAAVLVEAGQAEGLYEFQRMFGGMGSLNDIVLDAENERLDELRKSAWELAQQVDRSHFSI